MSLLEQRNSDIGVIEGRFIRHQLKIYGEDVMKSSKLKRSHARTLDKKATVKKKKKVYKTGFENTDWNTSTYEISNNSIIYTTPKAMRFVDMKRRRIYLGRGSYSDVKRVKNHSIHNKPTMVHKKYLVKMLSFGFTEEVKEQFRKLSDEEI